MLLWSVIIFQSASLKNVRQDMRKWCHLSFQRGLTDVNFSFKIIRSSGHATYTATTKLKVRYWLSWWKMDSQTHAKLTMGLFIRYRFLVHYIVVDVLKLRTLKDAYKISVRITSSIKWCVPTQVIFIQLDLLHHRGHYKGERLPVEAVQCIAHKHGKENSSSVVAISRLRHSAFELSSNDYKWVFWTGSSQTQTLVLRLFSTERWTLHQDPLSTAELVGWREKVVINKEIKGQPEGILSHSKDRCAVCCNTALIISDQNVAWMYYSYISFPSVTQPALKCCPISVQA